MQQNYQKIKAAGLVVAAISYDSPDVLREFATRKGIQFPLLSDSDSKIIRSFGILNMQAKPDSAQFGIPYPGVYVLDPAGMVTAKYFEDDYKDRDTAAVILMRQFGMQPDENPVPIAAKHLQLVASTSDRDAAMGLHLSLSLQAKLDDRVHVYAPGVQGYIPIDWKMDDSTAYQVSAATYPRSKVLRLEAIQESVPVYEGEFRLSRDLVIRDEKAVRPLLDAKGNLTIQGTFRYQACDDSKCFLPATVPVHWTVHFQPLDRIRTAAHHQ